MCVRKTARLHEYVVTLASSVQAHVHAHVCKCTHKLPLHQFIIELTGQMRQSLKTICIKTNEILLGDTQLNVNYKGNALFAD